MMSHLEGGFTLRCLQRSGLGYSAVPLVDNRYTRGPSTPVLSY